MISKVSRTIYVVAQNKLLTRSYYLRLWMAVRNIKISRRRWLNELADTFRDFDGLIIHPNGQPFTIPCLDETFGDDPDLRWLGYYLRPDKSGLSPQSISRKLRRLQLLDLYFRIKHPHIAIHFGK